MEHDGGILHKQPIENNCSLDTDTDMGIHS